MLLSCRRFPIALGTALLLCGLAGGCGSLGQSQTNKEHMSAAKAKMELMKAAVDMQMAQEQFMAGELAKALKSVDKSISQAPENAKAFVLRGRILLEQSSLEESRASLLQAEKIDNELVEAQYYLGIVHERFSQPEQALARFQRARELEPGNPQYVVATSEMLVALGRLDEAETLLARQGESLAHNSAIRQSQGQLAMLRGNHAKACEHFHEARLLAPDDATVIDDLIRAQVAAGRFADAEFNITQALKAKGNENRRDLQQERARCLFQLDRLAEARSLLSTLTAEEAGGKDTASWILLGQVCCRMQDWPRVRQIALRTIAMAPERSEGFILRATALRAEGDLTGAIASLERAAKISPTDDTPLLMLGMIQIQQNNLDGAKTSLVAALERNPRQDQARQLLNGLQSGRYAAVPE
ncbi:MAG: tetratricopeptide repeat protein [Phycisphaerales bacterium]